MNCIIESIATAADKRPNTIAVVAENQEITYKELWNEIRGFAAYISSLTLEKGSHILVKASPSIWYAVACFGIQLAGHVHIPVGKLTSSEGLKDIARKLSVKMVVSDIDFCDDTIKMLASSSVRELALSNFDEEIKFEFPKAEDVCDILFTTGTTGKPKGVILSHRAVVAVAENVFHGIGANHFENNIYLMPSPMDHAAGIRNLYLCMLTGTTAVLLDGFTNIKLFFQAIQDYHVTSIYMPPSAVRMILLLASKELKKYAKQIRFIYTSSAPFPETDKERLSTILPNTHLYYAYGCSEAGRSCIIDYSKEKNRVNCAGRPNINSRVFIVDDDRNEMLSSESNPGLIAISGATVMNGYYNDRVLTQKTLQNGIVYTNDIGYIDQNGYLYVMGRKDDVINLGGLKVAPTEVENVVLRFSGIAECACFASADKINSMILKLNIVEDSEMVVDISALREYMIKRLDQFKVPKIIEKVEIIPKTANGKIDRKVLK